MEFGSADQMTAHIVEKSIEAQITIQSRNEEPLPSYIPWDMWALFTAVRFGSTRFRSCKIDRSSDRVKPLHCSECAGWDICSYRHQLHMMYPNFEADLVFSTAFILEKHDAACQPTHQIWCQEIGRWSLRIYSDTMKHLWNANRMSAWRVLKAARRFRACDTICNLEQSLGQRPAFSP